MGIRFFFRFSKKKIFTNLSFRNAFLNNTTPRPDLYNGRKTTRFDLFATYLLHDRSPLAFQSFNTAPKPRSNSFVSARTRTSGGGWMAATVLSADGKRRRSNPSDGTHDGPAFMSFGRSSRKRKPHGNSERDRTAAPSAGR